jgi:hypothetical protein
MSGFGGDVGLRGVPGCEVRSGVVAASAATEPAGSVPGAPVAAAAATSAVAAVSSAVTVISNSAAVGMTAAAGWVVAAGGNRDDPWLWVLSAVTVIVVIRTRLNMLWLIAAGAALGALGLVG